MSAQETIVSAGYPLAFKTRQGTARPAVLADQPGRDVFVTEARHVFAFQKEAVVSEGATGSAWRLACDEGKHIKGTDLAPFPLGYYNAGLHGDLHNRLLQCARARGLALADAEITLRNFYFLEGSFVRGDGVGNAEPAQIEVRLEADAPTDQVAALVEDAVRASPALATMRTPLTNTFAIYINGRRRAVTTLENSTAPDATDPYRAYARPPAPPADADDLADLIRKTDQVEAGQLVDASDGAIRRVVRTVAGASRLLDPAGVTETDTWLELTGVSHFALKTDERARADQGPSGLALISAGIAFCYMTQLARYIEHQKFDIHGVRLVQYSPYATTGALADGSWTGIAEPVDTHLFLNGDAGDETHERLMKIAANTCYLHATLGAALPPVVRIEHNGQPVETPAAAAAGE